jgi:hypothetical protein
VDENVTQCTTFDDVVGVNTLGLVAAGAQQEKEEPSLEEGSG